MGIVEEIIEAVKTELDSLLTDYSRLDYEYNILLNSDRGISKRYGFTAGEADFVEGRALGFTTINQVFTLTLIDDYQPKDDDSALRSRLHAQYALIQNVLKDLQKSRLNLPTVGNRILLISGQTIDAPEIIEENTTVILRSNFLIQYNYKNN